MKATFEIQSWDESAIQEWQGGKLTHASVTKRFSGDIEGDAVLQYVMAYREDGTAAFVGIERIAGSAGDRKGGLVLQHVGNFADGAATAILTVVSGTDELADASGSGEMVADPAGRVTLDLG